ncbi:MAG: hypothetical protein RR459_06145, partial [Christensenellaceae bacterium]
KQYTKQITVYNIIEQEGKDVADKFNIQFGGNISDVHNYFDYDILINATSVGFKTQDTILNRNQIKPNSIVLDVVFVPTCTTFMKEAEAVGCTVLSGTQMIMNQACKQFELYTNIPAPVEIYESVMNDVEQNKPT